MDLLKKGLVLGLVAGITMFFCVSMVTVSASAQTLGGADVEEFLNDYIQWQMDEFNIPNVAVSVVVGGEVVVAKGYGYANLDKQIQWIHIRHFFASDLRQNCSPGLQ